MLRCNSRATSAGTFARRFGYEKEKSMVAVTYDVARVPAGETAPTAAARETAAPRKPWYVRFMDALIEARMAQARREIAHAHHCCLIPRRARQPPGQDRLPRICRSAAGKRSPFSRMRSRPGLPARGGFVLRVLPRASTSVTQPSSMMRRSAAQALRAIDRQHRIGLRRQQARQDRCARRGAASRRSGTASRSSGPSRILAKIRS